MILTLAAGADGHPREWIDTDTMTRHGRRGTRPCGDSETAYVGDVLAATTQADTALSIRGALGSSRDTFTAARDSALADVAVADAAAAAAQADKTQADALKVQADALAASATGDVQSLAQCVSALAALASGTAAQDGALHGWQSAVDTNLADINTGLLRLARLTAGLLNDPPT